MEFGKTLRLARENKGFSPSQLAEKTHVLVQIVEGLENEDFAKIVAPIYGRGFVKLYCEAVGLDPQPMITEFMALYAAKKSGAAVPQPSEPQTPKVPEPTDLKVQSADRPSPSRFAAPQPLENDGFELPIDKILANINWRLVSVIGGALLVLILIICGIRALYRATTSAGKTEPAPIAAETASEKFEAAEVTSSKTKEKKAEAKTEVKEAGKPTKRKSTAVKPFYID